MATIRRAAVFGGSGFIGRYIVKRLAERGVVTTVVARHARDAAYLKPMGDVGQITLVDGSIRDEALIRRAVETVDTVVSLAGILAERGVQRFASIHRDGAATIARCAAEAGVAHLLHVSAIGADPASASLYARTKAEGEAAIRAAFPAAIVLRPSIVFGPEDQFFNRFAQMARYVPALPLIGGGVTRFQPVYVGDVADAALAALDDPNAPGRTYELGGPKVYTFRALMEYLLKIIDPPDDSRALNRHALVTVPFPLASMMASVAQFAPGAPLTPDQVTLLRTDNVVTAGALSLHDLGISPTAIELIVPTYLNRFRPGGWYSGRLTA